MKSLKPWLAALTAGALLFAGNLFAQDMPAPPASSMSPPPVSPPPTMSPPPTNPTPANPASSMSPPPASPAPTMSPPPANAATDSASYSTPKGDLTVRSAPAPAPDIGPAPAFEQLSGGNKTVTEEQAAAYPALANDFIHADSNRNGGVSESEYTRWTKQL